MNNFRLSTNAHYNPDSVISDTDINAVLNLPTPYDIHPKYRTIAGTNNFVSEGLIFLGVDKQSKMVLH
jgi:hypothetical protein